MTRPLRSTDPGRIGDYELVGRIGGGGMGDVFLGRSPSGRLAAVKVVRDLLADDPRFRARFRREVEAARRVGGAYTAPVLAADPDAERPWLATAYIDGPSLADKVEREGPLAAAEVRRLGAGLAEALRDIHRAGLVHRDLKPGNVLLADDGPRLIDFGIIRAEDGAGLTETGYVLGSAGYMAPEQAAGGEATAAADVYALGAVLAFAATGTGPFGSGSTPSVLLRQASSVPDIAAVPEGLRSVVARCLETEPETRPSTDTLLMLLGDEDGSAATRAQQPAKSAKSAKKNRKTYSGPDEVFQTRPRKPPADRTPFDKTGRTSSGKPRAKNSADTSLIGRGGLEDIAGTPTTVMPARKAGSKASSKASPKAGSKAGTKTTGTTPPKSPEPYPTRRKFLILGGFGAAVVGIAAGIAKMPGGDTRATGGEVGSDNGADTGAEVPTAATPGMIGGPLRTDPLWSATVPGGARLLTVANGVLFVSGSGLAAFDGATGRRDWAVPDDEHRDLSDSNLPVVGDTVYELDLSGHITALSVKDRSQQWSAPPPPAWTSGGLAGASADAVVAWAWPKSGTARTAALFAADPRRQGPTWTTEVSAFRGAPLYNTEAGVVVLSQPDQFQVTAYKAADGTPAWSAREKVTQTSDPAFATALASRGKTTYWAANRLYAIDENGAHIWPVGVAEGGNDGLFHAVIADDDLVYAAVAVTLGDDSIVAYKASDGAPQWRAEWPKGLYNPSLECELALGGGNLYVADRFSRTLVALKAATGETLWQYHDKNASNDGSSPEHWHVAADDKYVYVGYDNSVRAFTANM